MSGNSSSNSNDLLDYICSTVSSYTVSANLTLRVVLLVPLSTVVLYLGHQKWKQQRSFKTASHSDVFTYHMAVMEWICALGCIFFICGTYTNHSLMAIVGNVMFSIPFCGGGFFHVLTCVERYLAVVHPITYRGLRNAHGVRIRNISIGCAWLISFGVMILYCAVPNGTSILVPCILGFSIGIITFCSLSVLCVLIRPGPGGREKEQAHQLKLRAFHAITAILGVLWLWFLVLIVSSVLTPLLSGTVKCVMDMSITIFNLPSSFVLPLLYLHRERKLSCCFYISE